MKPYFDDGTVQLYLGDCRKVLPALALTADLIVADPPYAETSLAWDRWPDGWLQTCMPVASSMWCFGSMRMFLERRDEFASWKLSQDIIWRKQVAAGSASDRFRRCHEIATHWYRGPWAGVHHVAQRTTHHGRNQGEVHRPAKPAEWEGARGAVTWSDNGTRLLQTVLDVPNMWKRNIHPTEKPVGILTPLIEYACPPGGQIIDPFAGSGSALEAARLSGRRAIGIERHEPYIEKAAQRLAQAPLEIA
jgi:site-specific DNA-methyltransferase (adenine-specific)